MVTGITGYWLLDHLNKGEGQIGRLPKVYYGDVVNLPPSCAVQGLARGVSAPLASHGV